MTRNNLNEHLSWLLNTKPSVPPAADFLPPATASFSSISATDLDSPQQTSHGNKNLPNELSTAIRDILTDVGVSKEMVRVRTAPGSPSKPTRTGHVEAISKNSPLQIPAVPHSIRRREESTVEPPVKSEGYQRPRTDTRRSPSPEDDDIEIMDLTESTDLMKTSPFKRVVAPISGRKRKSEELETGRGSMPSVQFSDLRTHEFSPMTEGVAQEADAPSKSRSIPADPPPPYSTHPFEDSRALSKQTRKPDSGQISINDMNLHTSNEQDDEGLEEIVNFMEPKSTSGNPLGNCGTAATGSNSSKSRMPPFTADVKSPSGLLAYEEHLSRTEKYSTSRAPESSGPEVSLEDVTLLKRMFASSESTVKAAIEALNQHRDTVCFELTEGLDQDLDVRHLEVQLDKLDARVDNLSSLWNKRALYRTLSDEKDRLKDLLLQAVRARHGVDAAKIANLAGKEKLRKLEAECSLLLSTCRQDIASFVVDSTGNESRGPRHNVAVESTQPMHRASEFQSSSAPSSSRIVQTQYHSLMPPPPPPPKFAKTPVSDHYQGEQYGHGEHEFDEGLDIDDIVTRDDLVNDSRSSTRSRKPKGHNSHMGTPPMQGVDDEEFGLDDDDDDDMLEWAQDIENKSGSIRSNTQQPKRLPLAETSGNSQAKYHATAVKGTKSRSEQLDDLERRHFIHPWSNDVKSTLKQRFKLKGFRQGQVEAINATLGGKDVFVLMPTGGGKSLCYQLPSLISSGKTRGVTIVVSPLMSLMEDQVRHLTALGIQAFLFNSETSREERSTLLTGLQDPNVEKFIQVLYVTPELLSANQRMISALDRLHQNKRMARLVIDEAHCVSQWGHDFRPDYKALGETRRRYPSVPVMALTATATENVKVDTIHNLGIDGCDIFSRSFNRPNLYYEIRAKGKGKEDVESIAALIKDKYHRQCGIIYCFSRKNCEDVAQALRTVHRIKAHHYHAGMEAADKSQVQQQWQAGSVHVIVATIAFGMGIDKPNVRFVIHHSLPKSLEGYYQETGRAGRDGKRSDCYLYFGYQDASKLRRMIDDDDAPWEQKERQRQMLRKMVQFCDNESDCRRVQILAYFDERFRQEDCKGLCNNCNSDSTFEEQDFTQHAQRAINIVRHVQSDKVTILHCIEVYRGAETKKIRDLGHDSLDDHGAGKKLDKGDVVRLFYRLISEGAIREIQWLNKAKFPQQSVQLGENCNAFGPGKERLLMQVRASGMVGLSRATAKRQNKSRDTGDDAHNHSGKATGSSSAFRGLPASTNVSSPVQPLRSIARSRTTKNAQANAKGNIQSHFIVSDSDDEDGEYQEAQTESDDEAFEPVRQAAKPRRRRATPELGLPITSDSFMDGLNDIHRCIVEQFVEKASNLGKSIMTKKNLHMVPFSDTILREMAARFTETEDEMLVIPGIDPMRVEAHGKHFAKLVKQSHRQYQELMATEDRSNDKHAQNVIDLVSDEEEDVDEHDDNDVDDDDDDEYGSLDDDLEEVIGGQGSSSSYFPQHDRDVAAFNAKFMNSQSVGMRTIAASQPVKTAKPRRKTKYSAKSRQTPGSGASYSHRNPSGEFDKFRYNSGSVSKKKKTSERAGGKGQSSGRAAPRSTPKPGKKATGFSIPTMPT